MYFAAFPAIMQDEAFKTDEIAAIDPAMKHTRHFVMLDSQNDVVLTPFRCSMIASQNRKEG